MVVKHWWVEQLIERLGIDDPLKSHNPALSQFVNLEHLRKTVCVWGGGGGFGPGSEVLASITKLSSMTIARCFRDGRVSLSRGEGRGENSAMIRLLLSLQPHLSQSLLILAPEMRDPC